MKKASAALVIALLLLAPTSSFAADRSPQRIDVGLRDTIAAWYIDMLASAAVLYGDCKAVASAAVLWGDFTQPDQTAATAVEDINGVEPRGGYSQIIVNPNEGLSRGGNGN